MCSVGSARVLEYDWCRQLCRLTACMRLFIVRSKQPVCSRSRLMVMLAGDNQV